jgi:hypothetical protein
MNTTTKRIGWFGVLAGWYRGSQLQKKTVAHAATADEEGFNAFEGKTLCGYDVERLCDAPAEATEDKCPKCLARLEARARREAARAAKAR